MKNNRTVFKIPLYFAWIFAALVVFAHPFSSKAQEDSSWIFDNADLFNDEEEQKLAVSIGKAEMEMGMDMVIVTADDAGGKDSQEFADDFYDEGGFGTGDDYSGVLFLIDMDNRELTISTSGKMIDILTDERIDTILDGVYTYAAENQFYQAADRFVSITKAFCVRGTEKGQYRYDTETAGQEAVSGKTVNSDIGRKISLAEILGSAVIAAVTALIACVSVKNSYAMKNGDRQVSNFNLSYRSGCNFICTPGDERLVNRFVTKRRISTSGGRMSGSSGGSSFGNSGGRSSVHHSSSGRSHGGGSRKF